MAAALATIRHRVQRLLLRLGAGASGAGPTRGGAGAAARRSDRRIALKLKTPWHDGMREPVFEPLELLERLAAMTPRPETNLLICHGLLAARANSEPPSAIRMLRER